MNDNSFVRVLTEPLERRSEYRNTFRRSKRHGGKVIIVKCRVEKGLCFDGYITPNRGRRVKCLIN